MSWKIFFERTQEPVLPEGWFGGKHTSINQPIYMRTPDEAQAAVLQDRQDVISRVRQWREKGYPCRAVPPIILHEVI